MKYYECNTSHQNMTKLNEDWQAETFAIDSKLIYLQHKNHSLMIYGIHVDTININPKACNCNTFIPLHIKERIHVFINSKFIANLGLKI